MRCRLGFHDWEPYLPGPNIFELNANARCRRCGTTGQHFPQVAPTADVLVPYRRRGVSAENKETNR